MKQPIPTAAIVAAVVILAALAGFLYWRSTEPTAGAWTSEERVLFDALEKAGGDPAKMDPEMRKKLDTMMENHPMSSRRAFKEGQAGQAGGGR